MMRYFVKSHFSGWNEVSETMYHRFCQHLRDGATAIKSTEKEQYIQTRAVKIDEDGNVTRGEE